MDELGSILREAREARALTLEQVEDETRINRRFLAAMESGQYQALPTPVHVRGYLRNYARFLGLDPQPLLERYEANKGVHREAGNSSYPPPVDQNGNGAGNQPFFNPVNLELGQRQKRDPESRMRLAIIAALLVVIALVARRFLFVAESNPLDVNAAVSAVLNSAGVSSDSATVPAEEGATPTVAGSEIVSTSRNVIELPTPSPTRPALPATMETVRLRVEITERTWFRATIDGEVQFEGLARQGDTFEWEARQQATILTGNGAGTFVTINDIRLGKLGGRGEVVSETWAATGN